jgi:L-idonate 5-dehydrogenase
MKAAVLHAPGDLRIEDRPASAMLPDDIVVNIRAGGICGSDLHYFQHGGFGAVRLREPMILGHEVAGVIAAVGAEVSGLSPGDHVAINPSLPCRACSYCLQGLPNHCLDMRFYGSAMRTPHVQGALREQLVCKASQAELVPKHVPLTSAAFAEPLAVCLHAVGRAGSLLGKRVLVSGAGPIGALTALAARYAGAAELVVIDLLDEPLAIVLANGADRIHNIASHPDALTPYRAAKGYFDVVFEASGSEAALANAIDMTRPRGAIVQIGLFGSAPVVPMGAVVAKEIELKGSFRFHDEFAWAVQCIASGAIDVKSLLTAVIPLADAGAAFTLASDRRNAMKIQIGFPSDGDA